MDDSDLFKLKGRTCLTFHIQYPQMAFTFVIL